MTLATPYQQLEARMARLNAVREASEVLFWDMSAMMPSGGHAARGEQLAVLGEIAHEMLTAPDMADLIGAAEIDGSLDHWQRANLNEIKSRWKKATALTGDQVAALSRASTTCEAKWRRAREDKDFAAVLPELQTLLDLVHETGQAKAEAQGLTLYDALLDDFEPGGRCADIDVLFDDLAAFLPDFLGRVLEKQAAEPAILTPEGPFPVEKQRGLGVRLMEAVGFDFDNGRLDVSLHPFCGGVPDDVRITTRYDEADFTSSLMGVLHETGHAMYERGLPADRRGQPVGEALGMSIHESQSLLIEMQVCRSGAFLDFAAPIMCETFGGSGPAWETENLTRLYSRVKPGFIRVDADEVTYPAHVILRYRLERAMLAGDLALKDLPGAWNDGMNDLLGIQPPDDALGCLQDVHWYDGAWGYFPTYTLGAMTAAQLYAAANEQIDGLADSIRVGDFKPLMAWLRKHVHGRGRSVDARTMLTDATGSPLDASVFKAHLERRYLGSE